MRHEQTEMEDGQCWREELERWRQIVLGIGEAPHWDTTEGVCVQTPLEYNESQSAWVAEACAAGR